MSQIELTNFLKKQNMMLKQQNKQLKTLLELNRQALKLSTRQSPNKKGQTNYLSLVSLLFQQNSKLHRKVNQLTVDLQTGMCKALISEQIAFVSTEQEKYLTSELKDKLIKMRKQLELREKKIVELTKIQSDKKSIQNNPELKIIQIVDLATITKKFKDQINDLRNEIEIKRQQVNKFKAQKQQLLKLNLILTKQINQYKLITSHQSTGGGSNQFVVGSTDLSKFMSYQKKIIEDQDDQSVSDQDQYKNSSEEGEGSSQMNQSQPNISLEQEPSKILKAPKLQMSKVVPKLQLSKAKQIQELIVQKINNDDNKKKGVAVKQQKFKKYQVQIGTLRKKIGNIMLDKIQLQKQNSFLKKYIKQLQSRNQFLCSSNKKQDQQINQSFRYALQQKFRQNDLENGENANQQYFSRHHENGHRKLNYHSYNDTETLIDICKDVTLNPILKKVINGMIQLPYNPTLSSYDI